MENKKTKLTISGTAKKTIKNIEIARTQGKNSVVIDKSKGNYEKKGGSFKSFNAGSKQKFKSTTPSFKKSSPFKSSFTPKIPPIANDFERRKLAEQRATKRLKGDNDVKKSKIGTKRES